MNRDLNDTLVFLKVVEAGSFIAAARALRLPKTTVSRKVQNLELRLGAQLLHRTTRKLGLTEAGYVYYENCQRIARELEEAESAVAQLQGGPRGWLRITAPYSLGIERIAPLLREFRSRHPELKVEMLLSNESLDLIDRELDVALRIGDLPDSGLIARPLARLRTGVFASPAYIERHGEPRHPDELIGHHALGMQKMSRNGQYYWPLGDGTTMAEYRIDPILVANDPAGLRSALLAGEGLMLASDIMVKSYAEGGCVRRVLPEWSGPEVPLSAVFPRGRVISPKVRAFVDFMVERLNVDADYMELLCPGSKHKRTTDAQLAAPSAAPEARRRLVRVPAGEEEVALAEDRARAA
jgi:DNA-binding transcriptional LysR family regulator